MGVWPGLSSDHLDYMVTTLKDIVSKQVVFDEGVYTRGGLVRA